jgi:hypothetical protein
MRQQRVLQAIAEHDVQQETAIARVSTYERDDVRQQIVSGQDPTITRSATTSGGQQDGIEQSLQNLCLLRIAASRIQA